MTSYIVDDAKIGFQIKKARTEAQLTQSELGEKIGVTWEMVSRYENGKSSPRKNLEYIAQTLGKPIQYFFGVEESSIGDEIKRLSDLLDKKGSELESIGKIPFIETVGEFTIPKALKLTSQSYHCPSWIFSRYTKAFALKLDEVSSDTVPIRKGDLGYFTNEVKPEKGAFVLTQGERGLTIEKFSSSMIQKSVGVLIALEKRYLS